MSATEELRRMLDERGIHWWAGDDERKTLWESNGLTWEYFNDENGDAWLGFLGACEQDITPEQAIAATLGGGKLTAEQVREAVGKHWHDLPAEYDMPEAAALPEYSYDWQAIADELNAIGCGECRVVKSEPCGQMWVYCHEFSCDCGQRNLFTASSVPPEHCPSCDRKVVEQ